MYAGLVQSRVGCVARGCPCHLPYAVGSDLYALGHAAVVVGCVAMLWCADAVFVHNLTCLEQM